MGKGGDIVVGNGKKYAAPLLVLGCVVFGLGSLIVRSVPVGSYAIAFWRLLISVFVFWFLARFFGQKFPKNRKTVRYALTAGVFLAFDLALWHESIHAVGPGISTLLNSLQIFFLSAIGVFFFGERLSGLKKAGLISAVAGVAMIAGAEFGYNGNAVWGFVSGLVSALSMVFVRKTHEVEPVALFPSMMILSLGGAVSLVVPALLMDGGVLYPTTWKDAGLVLVYGVVMQCFAWAMVAYAIPLLSLSLTGLLLLSEPVAALFIDYFGLGKPIEGVQWAGVALTLSAIYLGSLKQQS
ncbi:EamA family transporter [Neisseria meningitidis]|uniref:DMT family transporter n=1 Tax=Neisseria meningitidis TaxID=487 RepID=UPI000F542FBC|nr:DMT family transporter [Neisseria meningitidis]RQL27947.1 EamA family transporter [Neisseria meningitidis]